METDTIIIDFKIDGDVQKKLADTTAEIKRLKAEQKQLSQFIKEGADVNGELSAAYAENAQKLRELTAAEKTYTAQLNTTTASEREYGDSVYQLSARLADLKNQYRGLTKEQRESVEGVNLKKTIQDLDKEVKGLDADLGDHQRNVGNYVSALTGLDSKVVKVAAVFQGGFKNGLKTAGEAVKSFGKTLLTTPIGWIAAAVATVVAVFNQLRDAFKRNDDASTQLSAAMAKLQPIVTAIHKVFDALATAVAKVVSGFMDAVTWVAGKLSPSFKEAADAASDLVVAEDKLEEKQIEYTVNNAERERQISELRKKAVSDQKLNAAEKAKIYKDIDNLEKQDLEERRAIAEENYRIIKQKFENEVNTSDEAKQALAEARAAMIKTETEYNQATMRIAQREAAALQESINKYKEAQKERRKNYIDALRSLQDLQLSMIKDVQQREIAALNLSYSRQIEDLQNRLKTEKNLTTEARKAINNQIILLDQKLAAEIKEISKKYTREQMESEIAEREKLIDMRVALWKDGTEKEKQITTNQIGFQIDAIKRRLDTEENMTESMRKILNSQIEALELQLQKELTDIDKQEIVKRWQIEQQETANQLQQAITAAGENERAIAEAKLTEAQNYYNSLLEMDAETKAALFKNEEDYKTAVINAEAEVAAAYKANNAAIKQQIEQIGDTAKQLTSSLSDVFEAVAGDSETYEQFRKAMAIVDATISLAQAIASATAVSTEGDPYTMAIRIAANVAAVTAQFASLIAAIKSAAIPNAPKFADGGIVGGKSLTGDRVPVMANKGEMFLNMEQQAKLFDLIRGGLPTANFELLKAAMIEAYKEAPAPVLDYSEFTGFQKSVKMIERRTKL